MARWFGGFTVSGVYNVKRKVAGTVPWGAPVLDVISEDVFPGDGILTFCDQFVRYLRIQDKM